MKDILYIDVSYEKSEFVLQMRCRIDHRITGIFGVSGAGKTTLMHLIAGLEKPGQGVIRLYGQTLVNTYENQFLNVESRHVGYVFQDGRLFPHFNVRENLNYGLKYRRREKPNIKYDELVDLLEIRNILNKRVENISGGERQRVALGRTLMTGPDLLLLDEPFAGLDQPLRRQIIPYLKKIAERYHVPMLIVSHDLPDLLRLTDHLMIVHRGQCLGMGGAFDLIGIPDAYHLMTASGVINCFDLLVDAIDDAADLLVLSTPGKVVLKAESSAAVTEPNIPFKVQATLRPEDITLALHKIEDISIQNQIVGKIIEMKGIDRKVYCLVDCGINIMAEITSASANKLALKSGMEIWCLFKAAALKVNRLE